MPAGLAKVPAGQVRQFDAMKAPQRQVGQTRVPPSEEQASQQVASVESNN